MAMGPEMQTFELPPPIDPAEKQHEKASEAGHAAAPETQTGVRPPAFGSMVSMQPALTPGAPSGQMQPVSTMQSSQHTSPVAAADDTSIIEREWVLRAKALFARTQHDPRLRAKEFSKFKADYIKKRYNKDINVTE